MLELVERIMPNLAPQVKLYTKPFPIFEEYGVQAEIDKALKSKVWLKSGGSIVINQTEALVAIDVNTGRYVGKKTERPPRGHDRQDQPRGGEGDRPADPAARSRRHHRARLHRHGGEEEPPEGASRRWSRSCKKDRSPSKALQVSDFGLVIITRKRVKQSLERVLTEPCPYCSGTGVDQVELDDLLRDPDRGEEGRPRSRTATGCCCA